MDIIEQYLFGGLTQNLKNTILALSQDDRYNLFGEVNESGHEWLLENKHEARGNNPWNDLYEFIDNNITEVE